MQTVLLIGISILGIGFLILVHEFGHFLVAKLLKIKVEVFSIGFGPAFFKFKRGETEYRLSIFLPFGGYVKLYGETSKEADNVPENDKRAMVNRPAWQQIAVIFAGVFMNFIFGVIFCIIVFMLGLNMSKPIIGNISQDSFESRTPLSVGDTIISVNDKKVRYLEEYAILALTEKKPLKIKAKDKYNNIYEFTVTEEKTRSGISPYLTTTIEYIIPNSPMSNWGFQNDDTIKKVGDNDINSWQEFTNYLSNNIHDEMEVTVLRKTKLHTLNFKVDVPLFYKFDSRNFISTKICDVKNYSLARNLGIQKGQRILSINKHKTENWYDLTKVLWMERNSKNLLLEIEDEKGNKRLITTPNKHLVYGKPLLGIISCEEELGSNTFQTVPERFKNYGIIPGTILVEVNNKKVNSIKELFEITSNKQEIITLKVQTVQKEIKEVKIPLESIPIITEGVIGAVPKIATTTVKYPFFEATIKGFNQAIEFLRMTFVSIVLLIKKQVSTQDIAGPVGIIHMGAKIVQKSFIHFLYLLALISLNLAVLNLLPIPILDGSLIFMLILERIIGKKLPEKLIKVFEITGLCLLLFILAFALKNDIMRIIK